ncbi:branched-chain amino acid ABC transporter permease [Halobiforma nitratireducens]|uniref:Inner-membrane translocator n=1 Tax=Halobiforma nitratireducens JCM 10879 TaxID=1227454 RepID=M0ML82_9EURY|nr:branched-chain amino acid ABC transporter permease [Halobiforma nitratireducens]EMA46452.1 inner-membrane translocator [Halobiforma nitratireducens JCM 10879]
MTSDDVGDQDESRTQTREHEASQVATDGGTSATLPLETDAGARPRWQVDLGYIVLTTVAIYALITVLGLLTGLGVGGIFRQLQTVTFLAAAYALVVLALNLHWGYTGLFNIGVAGFMAVGAYGMAVLTAPPEGTTTPGLGLPLWIGIPFGVLLAGLVGLIVVLPALRIRADYFAIVTLAFAEVIRLTINSGALADFELLGRELGTGGGRGINFPLLESAIPRWVLYQGGDPAQGANVVGLQILTVTNQLGIERTVVESAVYTSILVVLVVIVFALLVRTANSPFGRLLKGIREDELATKSLGKNTDLVKIKVFVLGCAIMGLAGIFWQGRNGYVDPDAFLPIITFYIFIALIIGGSGSNTGSVVGALVFAGVLFEGPPYVQRIVTQQVDLPRPATVYDGVVALGAFDPLPLLGYFVGQLANVRFILFGVILILLMIYRPDGLLGHRSEPASPLHLSAEQSPADSRSAKRGGDDDGGDSSGGSDSDSDSDSDSAGVDTSTDNGDDDPLDSNPDDSTPDRGEPDE